MSLFGGDSGPPSPSHGSDFSISTIGDEGYQNAQSVGNQDIDDEQNEEQHVVAGAEEDDEDDVFDRIPSPVSVSAASETSDTTAVRQNRFRGSDRAWLHHTHAERSLAHSLDQLAAGDLALHLYSIHHVKARSRSLNLNKSTKSWTRKTRWQSIGQDGQKRWCPDSDWTAWPLESIAVPTGNEDFGAVKDGLDGYTLKTSDTDGAAHNLQHQLYAVLLGQASRSWASENPQSHLTTQEVRQTSASDGATHRRNRSRSVSVAPSLPRSSPVDHLVPSSSSVIDTALPACVSQDIRPAQPEDFLKAEDVKADDANDFVNPVFSADDDQSHRILHPTVRHMMSKLDQLLLALHQSRQPHIYRPREAGDTSDSSARSASRSRSRSRSKKSPRTESASKRGAQTRRTTRSASGKATPVPEDHVMFDDSGEDETYYPSPEQQKRGRSQPSESSSSEAPTENKSPTSTKRRIKNRKPGLRDWSEVLGIAALIGWDTTALQRTQERCKDLFNENMDLYLMPEHSESSADEAVERPTALRSVHTNGWRCPFVNCFRHISPLEQGFRWREHMRKAHKQENAQIARLEEQLVKSGHIALGGKRRSALVHNPQGWTPPDPLKCPHCKDSSTTYPKVGRLLEHMRRHHKYDPRVDTVPTSLQNSNASEQPSSADEGSDDFMVGGVHNDGFLQPIHRRSGIRGEDAAPRKRRANKLPSKPEPRSARTRRVLETAEPSPTAENDEDADIDMQD